MTATWAPVPEGSGFGIDNLPYGVFAPSGGGARVGVRIGGHVLDLRAALWDPEPVCGPAARLDIEVEVGYVVGTPTELAKPVSIKDFADHVFGICLVNDWSARAIQAWEYVPLGPFLGNSSTTSVSPWIV